MALQAQLLSPLNCIQSEEDHPHNVEVISTPHAETADIRRKLTHIKLAGKDHAVFAYVAAPDNSVKGVIHGIEPGTEPSEFQAHLRAQNHTILYARMLGQTQTAVITFEGTRVSHYVYYYVDAAGLYNKPARRAPSRCLPKSRNQPLPTVRISKPEGKSSLQAHLRTLPRRPPYCGNEELPAGILPRSRSSKRSSLGEEQQRWSSRSASLARFKSRRRSPSQSQPFPTRLQVCLQIWPWIQLRKPAQTQFRTMNVYQESR
ncbi:hypothetical protein HPB48_021849 [Haemaphysalis longicornis]|uniref:Uncharacterized protein n=1 Tax=Haemaphysalis longicornis TaxID=44386 RepID=A0A9J6GY17_HAELO|nr:hypothetical protein HPB48_021849 [Haemaphysalis longicornis]